MKTKIFNLTFTFFALLLLMAPIFIPSKVAQAACEIKTSWTRNLKPVTVKEIYADDIDQYILVLEVKGCSAGQLIGVYTIGSNVQGYDVFPAQQISGQLTKSIKFGKPALETYKYQFAAYDSTGLLQKRVALDVVYKAGSSPSGQPANTNTVATNSNSANSNSSTGSPPPDTNVSANLGSLDETIGSFFNPLEKETLPELMASVLRILFALIGMLAVIVIIVAGFRMVLSSGDPTGVANAKKAITAAIVGLVLSLMAFSIVAIVQRLIQG